MVLFFYTQINNLKYLDSISPIAFNTIKTKLHIHAVHSSRYLLSKLMFNLSQTSMVKYSTVQNSLTIYTEWSHTFRNDFTPLFYFVSHIDWLQNHCWLSVKSMTPNFVVAVNVLLPICCHIGAGTSYLCIFVKESASLLVARTDKWV